MSRVYTTSLPGLFSAEKKPGNEVGVDINLEITRGEEGEWYLKEG